MSNTNNQTVDLNKKPTQIDVGFRVIKIKYITDKPLNSHERELLERHINLHFKLRDMTVDLKSINTFIKILYKSDEKAKRLFNDWKKQLPVLLKSIENNRGKNDPNLLKALQSSVEKFDKLGEDYHKQQSEDGPKGQKTAQAIDDLFNNLNKLIEDAQKLAEYNNSIHQTKIENIDHPLYIKDFQQFDQAMIKFSAEREKMIQDFENLLFKIHNPLMQEVEDFKAEIKKQNEAVKNYVPDPKVKRMKVYELPANSEIMEKYSSFIDASSVRGNGLYVNITWPVIERCDTNPILDMIRVSQHKEQWLRNAIFGISLKFDDIPLTEPMGSNENIFLSPMIVNWFAELGKTPQVYFFLNKDLGPYILFADLMYTKMTEVKYNKDTNESFYGFMGEDVPLIFNKLFDGCVRFMEFCYGTGVDARPHIEYAIKDTYDSLNLGSFLPPVNVFMYEDVVNDWKMIYSR